MHVYTHLFLCQFYNSYDVKNKARWYNLQMKNITQTDIWGKKLHKNEKRLKTYVLLAKNHQWYNAKKKHQQNMWSYLWNWNRNGQARWHLPASPLTKQTWFKRQHQWKWTPTQSSGNLGSCWVSKAPTEDWSIV